ncbi:MAG: ornithine cyclodeaminase family protein, partial [Deltaproteobacteria bacterium]|nr:ornithine cyclodeaminase family protein [Deltaproteobacteria bacterium]
MLMFSQKTGRLETILLDEGCLTNVRTAAAGAVAAR